MASEMNDKKERTPVSRKRSIKGTVFMLSMYHLLNEGDRSKKAEGNDSMDVDEGGMPGEVQ